MIKEPKNKLEKIAEQIIELEIKAQENKNEENIALYTTKMEELIKGLSFEDILTVAIMVEQKFCK